MEFRKGSTLFELIVSFLFHYLFIQQTNMSVSIRFRDRASNCVIFLSFPFGSLLFFLPALVTQILTSEKGERERVLQKQAVAVGKKGTCSDFGGRNRL